MRYLNRRIAWSVFGAFVFGFLFFCNGIIDVVPDAEKAREINGLVLGILSILSIWCASPWFRWRYTVRALLIVMTLVAVGLGLIVWLNAGVSKEVAENTAVQEVAAREQFDPTSLTVHAIANKDGWYVLVLPEDEVPGHHWFVTVNHKGKVVAIHRGI